MAERRQAKSLTNLGPLPTNFAVASSCSQNLDDVYKLYTTSSDWYYLLQGPVRQTGCYPSGYDGGRDLYYSPARCPTGFTSACESSNVAGTITETVLRCCPTNANLVCHDTVTYGWEETLGCYNPVDQSTTSTTWTVTQVTDGTTSVITSAGFIGGVNAYQIQVGFQSTDFTTSSSTTRKTTTSTRKTASTAQPTSGSSSSSGGSGSTKHKTKKGSLSGGAAAGAAIGAIVGVLLLAAVVWRFMRNRRRRKAEAEGEGGDAAAAAAVVAEDEKIDEKQDPSSPPKVVHEMGAGEPAVELESSAPSYAGDTPRMGTATTSAPRVDAPYSDDPPTAGYYGPR
ncbi:putative Gag polyprotein [Rosellinia necatrix]|uniref:Putative Gag polyprotein n=1 Tax=Rosellinia necatrix TaxID=77044 RepID=A0A1W2TWT9_ROSNE|nr:putative Gag polyprotein [Rosellinia necatrix]